MIDMWFAMVFTYKFTLFFLSSISYLYPGGVFYAWLQVLHIIMSLKSSDSADLYSLH